MDEIEQEIDLDQITDENLLQSLLDQTDDPEDRKVIRDRIKELRAQKSAKQKAEQEKITKSREEMRKKEEQQKRQSSLATYENLPKNEPARQPAPKTTPAPAPAPARTPTTPTTPSTPRSPGHLPTTIGPKVDAVEDAIKRRQREAEERKKRILAAYDVAAKSAPAGAHKDVDFDAVNQNDVQQYEMGKTADNAGTFQMSGGVPIVKKTGTTPTTPLAGGPKFNQQPEEHLDAMERALRERQRECEERKRNLLEQYQKASKAGAGPKVFVPTAQI